MTIVSLKTKCKFLVHTTSLSVVYKLHYLCPKNVRFLFEYNIYICHDGVAMESPFGHILINIFIGKLERSVIRGLANKLNNWRRYVDDTICYIKVNSTDYAP